MHRLLLAILAVFCTASICTAQEFTDTKSNDLIKKIKTRFVREGGRSPFLSKYHEANAKFKKGIKKVRIKRDEYYEKEILLEKGYIISQTESSPFEKTIETFNIDLDGKLSRTSKRTTRVNGEKVLKEETDITSFAYGDTLHELHNFHANPTSARCDFNFAYVQDSTGLTTKKIANTYVDRLDTTYYEYDAYQRIKKEILGNKAILFYDYTPAGEISSIKRENQEQDDVHLTTFSYDQKNRLVGISQQETLTHTELRLRYDDKGRLVGFTCKTNDGEEVLNEECYFEYDEKGYIIKDCNGFTYNYKYDKKGNWIKCDIAKNGKRVERITRQFTYEKNETEENRL
ncbi:MAG: hypothetical protein J6Y37_11335 [Paludibacteraceae bacterium]|nr:hypothetical protein [Paludibacteraceae bacterium]MBP5457088.1 hypothetical protein [Paludibacteraceae bacterium]MBR4840107.1 hypothetical protein [Paludibacteraceae bacterium]